MEAEAPLGSARDGRFYNVRAGKANGNLGDLGQTALRLRSQARYAQGERIWRNSNRSPRALLLWSVSSPRSGQATREVRAHSRRGYCFPVSSAGFSEPPFSISASSFLASSLFGLISSA